MTDTKPHAFSRKELNSLDEQLETLHGRVLKLWFKEWSAPTSYTEEFVVTGTMTQLSERGCVLSLLDSKGQQDQVDFSVHQLQSLFAEGNANAVVSRTSSKWSLVEP